MGILKKTNLAQFTSKKACFRKGKRPFYLSFINHIRNGIKI